MITWYSDSERIFDFRMIRGEIEMRSIGSEVVCHRPTGGQTNSLNVEPMVSDAVEITHPTLRVILWHQNNVKQILFFWVDFQQGWTWKVKIWVTRIWFVILSEYSLKKEPSRQLFNIRLPKLTASIAWTKAKAGPGASGTFSASTMCLMYPSKPCSSMTVLPSRRSKSARLETQMMQASFGFGVFRC